MESRQSLHHYTKTQQYEEVHGVCSGDGRLLGFKPRCRRTAYWAMKIVC